MKFYVKPKKPESDDELEHSGRRGQKWGEHKFGRWQPQAKYANGQPDPDAKDKKVSEKRILDESRRSCEKLEKAYDDYHAAIRRFNEKHPAPDWHKQTDADYEISQAMLERYKKTFAYKLYGKKSVATFRNLNGDGGNCYVYSNSLPEPIKAMAEKKQREILDDLRKEMPEQFKASDDYIKEYKEWENHRENDSSEIEDALTKYKKAVDERVAELRKDPEALEYLTASLDKKADQWRKTNSTPFYTIDESIALYASDRGIPDDYLEIPEKHLDRVTKSTLRETKRQANTTEDEEDELRVMELDDVREKRSLTTKEEREYDDLQKKIGNKYSQESRKERDAAVESRGKTKASGSWPLDRQRALRDVRTELYKNKPKALNELDRAINKDEFQLDFLEAIQNSKIEYDGDAQAIAIEYAYYLLDPEDYMKNRALPEA